MADTNRSYQASCDTIVVFTGSGDGRRAIFAKSSDRPGVECQPLTQVPAAVHGPGATVRCQYLTIPQVPRTHAVLGQRPWWLWGFEQGVNEHGVAIGNEAIYTHDPVPETGLLGMDLVRLGLERGRTAAEAKRVITDLLEQYGQGGPAVYGSDASYHNSFIVADPNEAWVIETSRRHWVARRTTTGATIANLLTIEDDWDECSMGIEEHAREMGYWAAPEGSRFNFRDAYEDRAARSWTQDRYEVGCRVVADRAEHGIPQFMRYLRDHFEGGLVNLPLAEGAVPRRTVCIHPGFQPASTSATMVVELADNSLPPVAWICMATPCTGLFLPVTVGQELPPALEAGGERPSRDSAWWAMRELQYVADRDPALLTPVAQAAWEPIELELLDGEHRLSPEALKRLTARVLEQRDHLILQLTALEMDAARAVAPS